MKDEMNLQRDLNSARLHEWVMSFLVGLLTVVVFMTIERVPHYLATADLMRLAAVAFMVLLALVGLVDNLRSHFLLWQLGRRAVRSSHSSRKFVTKKQSKFGHSVQSSNSPAGSGITR